jgi:hypothetical protein
MRNYATEKPLCPECLRLWDVCLRLQLSESQARKEIQLWRNLCYTIAAVSAAAIIVLAWMRN